MKNLKLGMFIFLAIVLAIIPLVSSCGGAEPKTLKIGVILPLTGVFAETGQACLEGAVAAADWINDKGGITVKGEEYLIELIAEDNKFTPEGSIAAANKLVYENKVSFMIGPIIAWMNIATASVTEPAKVLRFAFDGTGMPEEINPDFPYSFRHITNGGDCIPLVYDYLAEAYPEVKTVASTGVQEPSALYWVENMMPRQIEAHGLTLVATENFPLETLDFYPILTKILASNPDAIDVGPVMPAGVFAIVKQARELGFKGPMFTAGGLATTTMVAEGLPEDLATDYFCPDMDLESPKMTPMIKEMKEILLDKYGVEMEAHQPEGWSAVLYMKQVIEAAQSFDTTLLAKTWEEMESIETPYGTATMGGLETYGINHIVVKPLCISRVHNGAVEFLGWFEIDVP